MVERRFMSQSSIVSVGPQGSARLGIDHFMRAYHTLLRSSGEVQLRALSESYLAMDSALHVGARDAAPDLAALTYATLRLPAPIAGVRLILLGQSEGVFARAGFTGVLDWQRVTAPGRRRLMLYDGGDILAVLIASPSDIDDLIPMLLAYEIEWNKIGRLLAGAPDLARRLTELASTTDAELAEDTRAALRAQVEATLGLGEGDWRRLDQLWDGATLSRLGRIAGERKHFALRVLGGATVDYEKVSLQWWRRIRTSTIEQEPARFDPERRPLYFVSSNTHSLVNLLSGYAAERQQTLLDYVRQGHPDLWLEHENIQARHVPSSRENFLYYVAKKYLQGEGPEKDAAKAERTRIEQAAGILHITSRHLLDIHAQVIELRRLDPARLDPRLRLPGLERLRESDAVVLNIDYPLGWAAYQVLRAVSSHAAELRGVYVMGKAATLNGRIGDVMIADHIYDEHSGNTFLLNNCFMAQDVEPYLVYGAVLDHQRAVATYGTFLQSEGYMDLLYRDGYTVLEAEAGPYLDAVYEDTFATRYPTNQVVNLYEAPYEVGFIHYASDTPYTKGQNLGSKNLSYAGMDPTYASALAIARRILERELVLLTGERPASTASRGAR